MFYKYPYFGRIEYGSPSPSLIIHCIEQVSTSLMQWWALSEAFTLNSEEIVSLSLDRKHLSIHQKQF